MDSEWSAAEGATEVSLVLLNYFRREPGQDASDPEKSETDPGNLEGWTLALDSFFKMKIALLFVTIDVIKINKIKSSNNAESYEKEVGIFRANFPHETRSGKERLP